MAKRNKIKPPMKVVSGAGRPGVDWSLLFDLWVVSNMPKRDFLLSHGISTTSGHTRTETKHWTNAVKHAERDAAEIRLQQRAEATKEAGKTKEPQGIWEFVMQCRAGQASEDWKTAQAVRSHVKMLLQDGLITEDGKPVRTSLTARDLVNIAEALERVQKVQRLALGMSTDNIGVNKPGDDNDDSLVEGGGTGDGNCPVFIVEVNDNGKFKRARPRQVK